MTDIQLTLPANGRSKEAVLADMQAARGHDANWRGGRVFSLVFKANDDVTGLLKDAYGMFFSENGLNPTAFPSLRRFETEVIAMVGSLLNGGGVSTGTTDRPSG